MYTLKILRYNVTLLCGYTYVYTANMYTVIHTVITTVLHYIVHNVCDVHAMYSRTVYRTIAYIVCSVITIVSYNLYHMLSFMYLLHLSVL